jgi:DNA-binding HxlR family transcriptional regulator
MKNNFQGYPAACSGEHHLKIYNNAKVLITKYTFVTDILKDTKMTNEKEIELELEIKNMILYVQDTLYVLGGKWRLPIIIAVKHGNKRFKDIKDCIPKITNRVLSKELKELEANKLIKRTVHVSSQVSIEYTFTDYATTVKDVVIAMANWGELHRKKIKEK